MVILIYSALFLIFLFSVAVFSHRKFSRPKYASKKRFRNCKRALLVIAHPDDECLFFAPTILSLCKNYSKNDENSDFDLHLLCLSAGNFYGQGKKRRRELRLCCQILGIKPENITLIQHTNLPDDPKSVWNRAIVAKIVLRYMEQLDIDTLLTFDGYGVSGHVNHRSIYQAVQFLYDKGKLPVNSQVFLLVSVPLWRKYLGFLDVLVSFYTSSYCYISGYNDIRKSIRAMYSYQSQFAWFRKLYVIFSRYMSINTYKRIGVVEKKMKFNQKNLLGNHKYRAKTPNN